MEDNMKIIVAATAGGIEIVVEGEKVEDAYTLALSKPQATELALKHTEHHVQDRGKAITNYW